MRGRIWMIGPAAVLGLSVSASAQTGYSLESRAVERSRAVDISRGASAVRADNNAAPRLLRKAVESVDWLDTPFEEVIDWLKGMGEGRVNIVPRWTQLGVEGVDRDSLVNLQLNNTTVAEVLNEVLENISPDGEVRYQAIGNTLKISTKSDFDRKMYVRVYDVTDILFRVPDFGRTAPNIDLQNTNTGGARGGGGSGRSVFQGGSGGGSQQETSGQQAEQELEERLEELRKLIEETIAPDSWDTTQTGGKGRIRVYNRSLVVYNTIEVHEEIAGLFSFTEY